MAYVKLCTTADVAEGRAALFKVGETYVLLAWPKGAAAPRAFLDRCSHEDRPLSSGWFDGAVLTCASHGWQFDATTGACLIPDECPLVGFAVKVEDGAVLVDLATPAAAD